jgi:hypothetical protein
VGGGGGGGGAGDIVSWKKPVGRKSGDTIVLRIDNGSLR